MKRMLSNDDLAQIYAAAGEEIWRSMQWFGRPDQRGLHPITCTCGDCT